MRKIAIDRVPVEGRRVLMRVDFNVPLEGARITDDRRISQSLASIRSVVSRGGRLVLMSHLGRPAGTGQEPEFSLRLVAEHLFKLLSKKVQFAEDCIGPSANGVVDGLQNGEIALLENLRFHAEETMIDKAKKNADKKPTAEQKSRIESFAKSLARHGDLYCNNAFGTCHRKHVSMYDVPIILGPGKRVCGDLVLKELQFLGNLMSNPRRPYVAILGGAKVSDKIAVIDNLLPRVDSILIGGAMAYTFFAAQGIEISKSLCERDKLDLARDLLNKAGNKLKLPLDSVCAADIKSDARTSVSKGALPVGVMGLDIGPDTIKSYGEVISKGQTIFWNGPMGVFETPPFDKGTFAIARALADATKRGATTIIGGGDSAAAVDAAGLADQMTHISTGGGASLEFLEGKSFPTIDLLDEAPA